MSAHEKVGVVVIHGVGGNFEGWTDHFLVPELERWRAFHSTGQLERKAPNDDLTLVVEAADRFIAVNVDGDDHFRAFCAVTGLSYEDSPKFVDRDARRVNRDELIAYASQVIRLVDASRWLVSLREASVPCAIAFAPESEVHRVRDPESSDPLATWRANVRRWSLSSRDVVMTELYWADLSKVGTTTLTRFSAILQLVMESPAVLGSAFVSHGGGVHALIRWMILFANWLMRRPIAGLSIAIFTAAFVLLCVENLVTDQDKTFWLGAAYVSSLGFTAVVGLAAFSRWAHRKIGLADAALSTTIFSILLIVCALGLPNWLPKLGMLQSSAPYMLLSLFVLLSVWFVWTIVIALTVVVVGLVTLKHALFGRSSGSPPVARAGASITLSVLLGMLWKLILSLAGVLIIVLAEPKSMNLSASCGLSGTLTYVDFLKALPSRAEIPDACALAYSNIVLIGITIINFVSIVAVLMALFAVMATRRTLIRFRPDRAQAGTLALPRLIANPVIIFTAFLAAIVNPVLIFGSHGVSNRALDNLQVLFYDVGTFFLTSIAGVLLLVFLYAFVNWLIDVSNSFVHVGRDLVNHQYNGVGGSLMTLIEPDKTAFEVIDGRRHVKTYRQRRRIQRRLEALIDEVIGRQDVDRLIFVGHSQGSVVLYDYLMNKDNLVRKDHLETDALADVKSIDIVTLGSPLTHIYKHYFHDYSENAPKIEDSQLMAKAHWWVNMWRIDDPIGQQLDVVDGITNIGLPPGGHFDYWREDQVCQLVWDMVWRDENPDA